VEFREKSGSVVDGGYVTASLGSNPTDTALCGVLTVPTNATGVASFDTLQINAPGDGYRLRVTASRDGGSIGISPADSVPFSVRLVVLNGQDAGPGSLRNAIALANASPNRGGPDVITLALPGAGTHTIAPAVALPGLTDPVIIDGTAGGACTGAAPTVEIDGHNTAEHGFFLAAPGSTIRGLSITNFASSFAGIYVSSSGSGATIECNYIGLAPDGVTVKPNGYGVRVGFASNTVGGTNPAARNVISGNLGNGILIQGPTPDSEGGFAIQNVVRNNYIGTDATGAGRDASNTICRNQNAPGAPLSCGNLGNGIEIENAQLNTIAGNVISANFSEGVRIDAVPVNRQHHSGNYIGTDRTVLSISATLRAVSSSGAPGKTPSLATSSQATTDSPGLRSAARRRSVAAAATRVSRQTRPATSSRATSSG
jgi:hypothetical protein